MFPTHRKMYHVKRGEEEKNEKEKKISPVVAVLDFTAINST